MKFCTWVLFVLMLLLGTLVHAEGGCPPGHYPLNAGSVRGCPPIPGYNNNQQYAPEPLPFSPPPPRWFAGITVDAAMAPFLAINYPSARAVEMATLSDCEASSSSRGGCRFLGWFSDQCGAFAFDQARETYLGANLVKEMAAAIAMNRCGSESHSAKCTLVSLAICAGVADTKSAFKAAEHQTVEQLEAISAALDTRDYWGSFASDGQMINASSDLPTEKIAEASALKACKDCRVALSFKNSCGAIAWPLDGRKGYEIGQDVSPMRAKNHALESCATKYGACEVAARCSGRAYLYRDPDAPPPQVGQNETTDLATPVQGDHTTVGGVP